MMTTKTQNHRSVQNRRPSQHHPWTSVPLIVEKHRTPQQTTTLFLEDEQRCLFWTFPLDETFYSEGEPRRIFLLSSPSPPSPPCKMKRKLEIEMSFPKKGECGGRIHTELFLFCHSFPALLENPSNMVIFLKNLFARVWVSWTKVAKLTNFEFWCSFV